MKTGLVWFRNNLRIEDNRVLFKAMEECDQILLLLIFEEKWMRSTEPLELNRMGVHRMKFWKESAEALSRSLAAMGGELVIKRGEPQKIIPQLIQMYDVSALYGEWLPAWEEKQEWEQLEIRLGDQVKMHSIWDHTLYGLESLPFELAQLPRVFTSFRKKVEKYSSVLSPFQTPETMPKFIREKSDPLPEIERLPTEESDYDAGFQGGSLQAWERVNHYFWETQALSDYKFTRNGMLGTDFSSRLSPWVALGAISPRQIYSELQRFERQIKKNVSTYWLFFELLWRDFFQFNAEKIGAALFKPSGIAGEEKQWKHDVDGFKAWATGKTGIPLVDANMRELNQSGYLSNRGRQLAASFLVNNLKIDWRWGAWYFERQLLDYDAASNWGNWAYIAGVGNDPRNRYFNILNQAKKYDEKGEYIRFWLPELAHISGFDAHYPWDISPSVKDTLKGLEASIYLDPIVNLEETYPR